MTETTLETLIRSLGGAAQIIGFLIAAAGITAARRRWAPEQPGILGRIGRLVDKLFRGKPAPRGAVRVSVDDAMHATGSATATVTVSSPTVEERLDRLEERAGRLEERAGAVEQSVTEETRDREAADDAERAAREEAVSAIITDLRELAAGNLRQETIGVALFLVGVALATWSQDLAGAFT